MLTDDDYEDLEMVTNSRKLQQFAMSDKMPEGFQRLLEKGRTDFVSKRAADFMLIVFYIVVEALEPTEKPVPNFYKE